MNIVRTLTTAAILVFTFGITSVSAQNERATEIYDRGVGEGWYVSCYENSTGFRDCVANIKYVAQTEKEFDEMRSKDVSLFIASDGNSKIAFSVAASGWRLTEDKPYTITVYFEDSNFTVPGYGMKGGNEKNDLKGVHWVGPAKTNFEFIEYLMKSKTFGLKIGKTNFGLFNLKGSRNAILHMLGKAKEYAENKTDTFGSSLKNDLKDTF